MDACTNQDEANDIVIGIVLHVRLATHACAVLPGEETVIENGDTDEVDKVFEDPETGPYPEVRVIFGAEDQG